MLLKKDQWHQLSRYLMIASFLAIAAAAWGFLISDLVLASTQWLLVATVLAIFGLYAKLES